MEREIPWSVSWAFFFGVELPGSLNIRNGFIIDMFFVCFYMPFETF